MIKHFKLRPFFSTVVRGKIVNALILSHLDYYDIVYGPCLLKLTKAKIQKVQNYCMHFWHNIPRGSNITSFLNSFYVLNTQSNMELYD